MLGAKFSLHDIADVEAFCERFISRSGITEFGYLDHDDLLAELVAFCWRLSSEYDPARAKFSTHAGNRLARFIADWKRSQFRTRWVFSDRIYERPKPVFVDLEHRPEHAHPGESVDLAADRISSLLGLQRAGDRGAAGRATEVREAPSRKAA